MSAPLRPRPRLGRAEARALTRQRLLDAAAEVVSDRGWATISLEEVAEAAGYSVGAVYSNFRGRRDLFTQLAKQRLGAVEQVLVARLEATNSVVDQPDALIALEDELPAGWWRLVTEVRNQAGDDPELQAVLSETHERCRELIAAYARNRWEAAGRRAPLPYDVVAELLMAAVDGLRAAHGEGRMALTSRQGLQAIVDGLIAASPAPVEPETTAAAGPSSDAHDRDHAASRANRLPA